MKAFLIWILLIACLLTGCACTAAEPSVSAVREASCFIEMIDVGQGLCILVEMDGHYLLYDGGGRETSSKVVRHLKDLGIESLDIMVASHYDEDHISGLVGVLSNVQVNQVIAPEYESDTWIYQSFQDKLTESNAELVHPSPGTVYTLGSGEVLVLAPSGKSTADENNCSVAVLLTYGKTRCIITGDAESEEEQEMTESGLDLGADLYVAGHHGSATSSSERFLEAVRPEYVFISCGAENPYGHPAARTMAAFRNAGAEIFRSDLQGSVMAYSDGNALWFNTDPCADWTPGTVEQNVVSAPGQGGYILNSRTMRFHFSDCESVQKMNPENRVLSDDSRDDLIARGYRPCGICCP